MPKKKSSNKYEQWGFALGVLTLIANIILMWFNLHLIVQTNQIRSASLEYQSMMYNFTSVIVANADHANLGSPSMYSSQDDIIQQTAHYGYLEVNLEVITPHYGLLSIKVKNFNVAETSMLNSEKLNKTEVSYAYEPSKYEYAIVSGLNSINDNLHLKALVYPNPENLPPKGESLSFVLGRLFLEAELFDVQTDGTITKEFSAVVSVVMGVPL